MIDDIKKKQVYEVLLTSIECTKYSGGIKGKVEIFREGNKIKTTQTYYPYKKWGIPLDPDMSDFAIGFYAIIYKEILKESILNKDDGFSNKEFAGDTMNSFNSIANLVPEAGKSSYKRTPFNNWPEYLQNYYKRYHCLANFWILPMEVGRKLDNEFSKGCYYKNKTQDYMDRFLQLLKENFKKYQERYREYFKELDTIDKFADYHYLIESYLYENNAVYLFSNKDPMNPEFMISSIEDRIKIRATIISESECADELWNYFNKLNLFRV